MIEIQKFEDLNLYDKDDLEGTEYEHIVILLNCEVQNCRYVSTKSSDDLDEIYYRLESDAYHIKRVDDLLLCELDEVKFVLYENDTEKMIFFCDKDEDNVQSMF